MGGTAGIRPHAALDSEVYQIENLLITSYLNTSQNHPKHLLMNVPSNMTVWELIDYIALKTNKSPVKLQLSRSSGKQEIKSNDYCKSLRQLNFESGEEITAIRVSGTYQRVPLINSQTGLLVREAEHIFELWFNKYSIPASEIEDLDLEKSNSADRYMTKHTALDFLQNAMADSRQNSMGNGMVNIKRLNPDDSRIMTLFQAHDLDKDDMLTLTDFLRFYRTKSNESPDTVWLNLQAHGYGNNLMKEVRGETTYENDPLVTKDQDKLPRSLIADNTEQLEMLFNLQSEDQNSNEQIWKLISSLKTNSTIYKTLLKAEDPAEELSPNKSVFKLQYYLQIVKHLLQK